MSVAVGSERSLWLRPLELLVEAPELPAFALPEELARVYGGRLGFGRPRLYANFVASVDGVVAIPSLPQSSHLIAAGSEHDRFLVGLLRACADCVVIGAGTLRASPRTRWTAEHAYPPGKELFAELRRRRDLPPQPTLALVSGSGRIEPQHPGLQGRTLVLTSEQGAAQLGRRPPRSVAIVSLGDQPLLDPLLALQALRAAGNELILCEGGPRLFAAFLRAGLVDELFLTRSPLVVDRPPGERRLSLLEATGLGPSEPAVVRLLSLRRSDSHLFLRYELGSQSTGSQTRPDGGE